MGKLRTIPSRLKPAKQTRAAFMDTAGGANRAHYQSPAHVEWARTVKANDRYTCQDCGAHGPGVRLIADHVTEIEDGGARLAPENGLTRCQACHNRKTAAARRARLE